MSSLWTIADLIDFHYFCRLDEDVRGTGGEAALAGRDRAIYLDAVAPQSNAAEAVPPRVLARQWLSARRRQHRQEAATGDAPLPGAAWRELSVLGQGLIFLCGLGIGIGGAGSLLLYAGATPLNVSVYFGLFVLLQIGMIALQGLVFGYRRLRRGSMETSAFYLFLGRALMRGLDGIRRRLQPALSGEQRLGLAAVAGGMRQRQELAALLIWPAFALVQLGGIGFNLGVIGATLAKVTFADMAFAWQSSLQLSADLVAALTRWFALPWSWWLPQAVPTLAQIQGSQIVLKEGIAHLETANLVAWWPFLCCAVLTYGLLPRCLLLILALVRQRRALARLPFTSLDIQPLVQRMTAPRLETRGQPMQARPASVRPAASEPADGAPWTPPPGAGRLLLLIPDELDEDDLRAALAERLGPDFGLVAECAAYGAPGASDAAILTPLATAGPLTGVLVLAEAWQPPLKETENLIRCLRGLVGEQAAITILLVGRPTPQTVLTPADPGQTRIWSRKMQALGDPRLSVRSLEGP